MPSSAQSSSKNHKIQQDPVDGLQPLSVQNFSYCNEYPPQQQPFKSIDNQYIQRYYHCMQQQQQQHQPDQSSHVYHQSQQPQYQYQEQQQHYLVQQHALPQQHMPEYYYCYYQPEHAVPNHYPVPISPTNTMARSSSALSPADTKDLSSFAFEQPHYQYGQQSRHSYPMASFTPSSALDRTQSLPLLLKSNKVCEVCQKSFNRPSGLRTHMHTHTGQKPFVCKWNGCNKKFSVRSNMIRHQKIHQRNET